MGILNCTPDSFYDGSKLSSSDIAEKGLALAAQGADILDVGGESSRPGATPVSLQQELDRVLPVLERLRGAGKILSIDTRKTAVAREALNGGATIVNDISAGADSGMLELCARKADAAILMHMQGEPQTMQKNPHYKNVLDEVTHHLFARAESLEQQGLSRKKIFLDPGIGFGKTTEQNLDLLKGLHQLSSKGHRTCLGVSRKSFISALSPDTARRAEDRLPGSLAALLPGLFSGAKILRVHDVAATRQFLDLCFKLFPDIMEGSSGCRS